MSQTSLAARRPRRLSSHIHESIAGYLLSLPAVLVLLGFTAIPIVASLVLVFMDYRLITPPEWSGADNLRRLFGDKRLWICYRNSLFITLGAVAGNNILGLLLGMGVNRKMPKVLKYFFRTTLFFPVITTTSSLAMVWQYLLTKDRGILNWLIAQIGLAPVPWLSSPDWAIRSVIMYDIWKSCGYLMVIYLAGLQGIPDALYEAAEIDGANRWQSMRHITLPLITPTAFFAIIISSIGAFQIFDNAYVLTGGGPADASRTIVMYIYDVAFHRFEMGYASAIAVSLLLILVTLTLIQTWAGRRWVHYE